MHDNEHAMLWETLLRLSSVVEEQHRILRLNGMFNDIQQAGRKALNRIQATGKAAWGNLADTGGFLNNTTLYYDDGTTLIQDAKLEGQSTSLSEAARAQDAAKAVFSTASRMHDTCKQTLSDDLKSYELGQGDHTTANRKVLIKAKDDAFTKQAEAGNALEAAKATVVSIVKAITTYKKTKK